jgi:hypothetical protein
VLRDADTIVQELRKHCRQIRTFSGRLVTKELEEAWFGTARVYALNTVQLDFPG